jgi:hypothetical protein
VNCEYGKLFEMATAGSEYAMHPVQPLAAAQASDLAKLLGFTTPLNTTTLCVTVEGCVHETRRLR